MHYDPGACPKYNLHFFEVQGHKKNSDTCHNNVHGPIPKIVFKVADLFLKISTIRKPFRFACKHGHLDVVKWLQTLKPKEYYLEFDDDKIIDWKIINELSFRLACQYGNLDIAKWLLQINPDIDISFNNEAPFLYGALAILLAISLGALTAWIRKIVSDMRKNKSKIKEVKFLSVSFEKACIVQYGFISNSFLAVNSVLGRDIS